MTATAGHNTGVAQDEPVTKFAKDPPDLTAEVLKNMLRYCPDTGVFTWLRRSDVGPRWNGRYPGKVAGGVRKNRADGREYWTIGINGSAFQAHRLAWLYVTGEWPKDIVDHEDGDGLNNSFENLREADKSKNGANSKLSTNSTSGFKGVCFDKSKQRFMASITFDGRQHFLGYHDTAEEAHSAYVIAAEHYFGAFARAA